MQHPVITLTTDFGLKDPYVAEMKAVILGICPDATVVDVSHQVGKFNIRMGAYILAAASPYFPKGTVHVAVVDPGVGTNRRSICIETNHSIYVGPDNGVMVLAAKAQGIRHAYEITNRKVMLPKVSNTFHGRDVFAPTAAYLIAGTRPSDVGLKVRKIVIPEFAEVIEEKDRLIGEVLHVDDFGNTVTNVPENELGAIETGRIIKIKVKNSMLTMKFCRSYGEVEAGKPLALIGSHNFLEISINQGDASRVFKAKDGDKVVLYRS